LTGRLRDAGVSARAIGVVAELAALKPSRRYAECLGRTLVRMSQEEPDGMRNYLLPAEYACLSELGGRNLTALHEEVETLMCLADRHALAQQLRVLFKRLRSESHGEG
jgi:hypothetical protein